MLTEAAPSDSLHADAGPLLSALSVKTPLLLPALVSSRYDLQWVLQWARSQRKAAHSIYCSVQAFAAITVPAMWSARLVKAAKAQARMLIPVSRSPWQASGGAHLHKRRLLPTITLMPGPNLGTQRPPLWLSCLFLCHTLQYVF